MSKLDAQRAMREAKWARTQAAAASRTGAPATRRTADPRPPVAPPLEEDEPRTTRAASTKTATKSAPKGDPADGGQLCGHASMNGRTCTRPAGHSQKSHRYA